MKLTGSPRCIVCFLSGSPGFSSPYLDVGHPVPQFFPIRSYSKRTVSNYVSTLHPVLGVLIGNLVPLAKLFSWWSGPSCYMTALLITEDARGKIITSNVTSLHLLSDQYLMWGGNWLVNLFPCFRGVVRGHLIDDEPIQGGQFEV